MITAVKPVLVIAKPKVEPDVLERVYVWDLVVRLTHWVIALSIAALSFTGIYIGHPFITVSGEAGQHFLMGTMRVVHVYFAFAFTLAVLSRIVWMFIGSEHARWYNFIPTTKQRLRDAIGMLKFYGFITKYPPESAGHNPLAGATYVAVFGLYLVMIATGFGLYSLPSLLAPFGGAQLARWIHHVMMWLLLGFVIQHVYTAILVANVEKNGTVDSIVSGYKWLRRRVRR